IRYYVVCSQNTPLDLRCLYQAEIEVGPCMLTFAVLQRRLVECLRDRVRNGELTERHLARLVGVSQPHMHNVLKGVRRLSPELADAILAHLHLSLDAFLLDASAIQNDTQTAEHLTCSYLNLLRGRIGPGHPWPTVIEGM